MDSRKHAGRAAASAAERVPSLKEDEPGKAVSMRAKLEEHRANPVVRFAAMRRWTRSASRSKTTTRSAGGGPARTASPIDASGKLPDGSSFHNAAEMKKILLGRRDEFVGCMTEKLLTYALGRGLEYYDRPVIREITRKTAGDDYRFSALVKAIVESTPFQMRRSPAS